MALSGDIRRIALAIAVSIPAGIAVGIASIAGLDAAVRYFAPRADLEETQQEVAALTDAAEPELYVRDLRLDDLGPDSKGDVRSFVGHIVYDHHPDPLCEKGIFIGLELVRVISAGLSERITTWRLWLDPRDLQRSGELRVRLDTLQRVLRSEAHRLALVVTRDSADCSVAPGIVVSEAVVVGEVPEQ